MFLGLPHRVTSRLVNPTNLSYRLAVCAKRHCSHRILSRCSERKRMWWMPRTKLTKKFFVSRLRFYVMAENLVTWTKYHGFDPEISSGATSLGIDRGVYPQARTWTVGVNLSL